MPPFPSDLAKRVEGLGLTNEAMARIQPRVQAEGVLSAEARAVSLLWHALDGGFISARHAARHLNTSLDELNAAFVEAGRPQPFDL